MTQDFSHAIAEFSSGFDTEYASLNRPMVGAAPAVFADKIMIVPETQMLARSPD